MSVVSLGRMKRNIEVGRSGTDVVVLLCLFSKESGRGCLWGGVAVKSCTGMRKLHITGK